MKNKQPIIDRNNLLILYNIIEYSMELKKKKTSIDFSYLNYRDRNRDRNSKWSQENIAQ